MADATAPAHRLRRICVLCGSSPGRLPAYADAARALAATLVRRRIGVVYGGARVGLMGALAEATASAGGEVIGVITPDLAAQVAQPGIRLETVATMHQRKERFAALADAYIALPGDFGTLDELFEALAWNQLRIFDKPTGVLNVGGYFDGLLAFLRHVEREGFVKPKHLASLLAAEDPEQLVDVVMAYRAPTVRKLA